MSTVASTLDPTAGHRSAGLVTSTLLVAGRVVRKFLRTPQLVVLGTIQGVLFLLIFRYVFGGAIQIPGIRYVDFLVPGFVTTGVLFGVMDAAPAVATDLQEGFVDRLRSLPIPRSAFLSGRALADGAVLTYSLALMTATGFAVGFRIHGSVPEALAAFGLCVLFGFAFLWVFIALGLVSGSAEAAQGMAFMVFPFSFISSAYVPVESMPGWMQAFAEHQPLTYMVDAVRALTQGPAAEALLGHTASYYVTRSVLWTAAIVVVFAPLAVARYRRS
jgi:ABC-2 type transport system permease protein